MDFECQTSPFLHCTWWHHQYYLKRSCPFHLPLFIKKICDYSSTVFRSSGLWLLMTDYDRRVRHGRQWEPYMMRMAAVHDDGGSNNWGHVQQLKHPKNLNRNSNMYTNTFFWWVIMHSSFTLAYGFPVRCDYTKCNIVCLSMGNLLCSKCHQQICFN